MLDAILTYALGYLLVCVYALAIGLCLGVLTFVVLKVQDWRVTRELGRVSEGPMARVVRWRRKP